MGRIAKNYDRIVIVNNLSDLPTPSANVITLANDTAYLLANIVNLGSNRIVCGKRNTIFGFGKETCGLYNNVNSQALITSIYTLDLRDITLYVQGTGATILNLDASTSLEDNNACDWRDVNFSGGDVGTIKDYDNFTSFSLGYIDKTALGYPALGNGFIFDGTIATVKIINSLLPAASGKTAIEVKSTATIQRRFRIESSSIPVAVGGTGINFSASATVPAEGYQLENVSFSQGGTYLTGVTSSSDKARIQNCTAITNTTAVGYYTMLNNATATTVASANVPYKVAGTTTNSSVTNKFTHSNNRLTYTGALTRIFEISAIMTVTSVANNEIGLYIAKNGNVITESETYLTANAGGKFENGAIQCLVELATNDYVEIFVENATGANNITVEFLSVTAQAEV